MLFASVGDVAEDDRNMRVGFSGETVKVAGVPFGLAALLKKPSAGSVEPALPADFGAREQRVPHRAEIELVGEVGLVEEVLRSVSLL